MSLSRLRQLLCGGQHNANLGEKTGSPLNSNDDPVNDNLQKQKLWHKFFVSLEVQTGMRQKRTSHKVILKTSITTVLLITVLFIVSYTIALTYFHPIVPLQYERQRGRARLKFIAKSKLGNNTLHHGKEGNRPIKWNITSLLSNESQSLRCKKDVGFLILIASSLENFRQRQAIRNTWCKTQSYKLPENAYQCVFLVGRMNSWKNSEVYRNIKNEIRMHNDILMGSYIDTYRNLTLKVLHGLYWSGNFCATKFVLKTDDDCFVNTKILHSLILHHQDVNRLYIGNLNMDLNKRTVIRNKENRWHVLPEDFSEPYYPVYARGVGYLLSQDVVKKIIRVCQDFKPIPNEDAFIGILARDIGLEPQQTSRFTLMKSGWTLCNFKYIMVIHGIESDEQEQYLKDSVRAANQCTHEKEILTWD